MNRTALQVTFALVVAVIFMIIATGKETTEGLEMASAMISLMLIVGAGMFILAKEIN